MTSACISMGCAAHTWPELGCGEAVRLSIARHRDQAEQCAYNLASGQCCGRNLHWPPTTTYTTTPQHHVISSHSTINVIRIQVNRECKYLTLWKYEVKVEPAECERLQLRLWPYLALISQSHCQVAQAASQLPTLTFLASRPRSHLPPSPSLFGILAFLYTI